MGYRILWKANLKRHKGVLAGIFFLMLLAAAALGTVLSLWSNSGTYLGSEMDRAGFGDLTAWVCGVRDIQKLSDDIKKLPEIGRVESQSIIFSDYMVNGQESDSEGQLITFIPEEGRYRFFTDDLSSYKEDLPDIGPGEIYVSPSVVSMFGAGLGDEIIFPIARAGKEAVFTVKGFYEDPFMGSSMIGMKGFLICEKDADRILSMLQDAGIDALARKGAMLHIFSADGNLTVSELNRMINENTPLAEYTEFVHSREAIKGFMGILQNAFSGLLLAFTAVLLLVVMVVLGHSIGGTIDEDEVNMGILKTIGFSSGGLRLICLMQYLPGIIAGMALGLFASVWLSAFISSRMITTTGVRAPTGFPAGWCVMALAVVLSLLTGFILLRTRKIGKIRPMETIRGRARKVKVRLRKGRNLLAVGEGIYFRLAFRQLVSGSRRYIGAFLVAVLLVFFASLVGRMDAWLGGDGKGMMDAFNPADHDIGVQVFGSLTAMEAEDLIRSYTDITDTYLLAMPGVAVNGVDYTANVISEPERFHLLEGRACMADDEIVLTEFVAAHFGVSTGDSVTVTGDTGSSEYVVSGIYSCANDMGDNVGMSREGYQKIGRDEAHIWCRHYFLADPSQKKVITEALEDAYGGDVHVHENTWPGLFGIIRGMQMLMIFMYGMVVFFILTITVMTSGKLLSAEQKDLGIYKAIGFQTERLRLTFALRFGMTAVMGSVIGTLLASAFTDPLVSEIMKLAGISNFASAPSPGSIVLPSGAVILLFTGTAYFAAGKMKKVSLSVLVAEG